MYCPKCGKQNEVYALHCVACSEPLLQAKLSKFFNLENLKNSRILSVIIVLVLAMAILFTCNGEEEVGVSQTQRTGQIGDYIVKIKNYEVIKSGGDNYLLVTYSFTNNSVENQAFLYAITDTLFQNGVSLDDIIYKYEIYSKYDLTLNTKEIKPGTTLDVLCVYKLIDLTTDVEVELTEWCDFYSDPLTYIITLD